MLLIDYVEEEENDWMFVPAYGILSLDYGISTADIWCFSAGNLVLRHRLSVLRHRICGGVSLMDIPVHSDYFAENGNAGQKNGLEWIIFRL